MNTVMVSFDTAVRQMDETF